MIVTRLQTSRTTHIVAGQKRSKIMRKTITHHEREWIKYRLALKNLTQVDIAALAGCTRPMVSNVIAGRKVSANVLAVLLRALGYESFEQLIADCSKHGGAA